MPNYDKLSVVVSVILLCLALSLVIELPTRTFGFVVLGIPLTIRFHQNWLAAALLVGMACSGTASIMRLHPLSQESDPSINSGHRLSPTFASWILPGLTTLSAAILLPQAPNRIYALGGLTTMGILLPLIITAEYRTVDTSAPGYRAVRLGLNFVAYLTALVLFVLIHGSQAPGFLMAAAALVGSSLLALDLLHGIRQSLKRTGLYALIVGLVMGEIAWALSYLTLNSLTAGIFLLLLFYLITGLARQGLLKLLSRRILVEFALVALIGLVLLLKHAP
ncbi:MAG: hypothetical protein ACE5I2_11520 [Anaerolineae bacterium]